MRTKHIENTTMQNGKRYSVGMLLAEEIVDFQRWVNQIMEQFISMNNQPLRENHSNAIKEELDKGSVVRVKRIPQGGKLLGT